MANNKMEENFSQKKTKYDLKMEHRKKEEEKERKSYLRFKITSIALFTIIAAAVIGTVAYNVISRQTALHSTYIKVGDHEITRLEYDYYLHMTASSTLSQFGMTLDSYPEFLEEDSVSQSAVDQIKRIKAIADDSVKQGYQYDDEQDFTSAGAALEEQAKAAGVTADEYCKATYGKFATRKNIEPFIRENLLASSYYSELMKQNQPTDDEIKAYYDENKNQYDKVDYHSFTFSADVAEDASEEDIQKAMSEQKTRAEEMQARLEAGEDFKTLCAEYAAEDQKASYQDAATDASLTEGGSFYSTPSGYSAWLYEEGRKAGDISVAANETANQYYVVQFVSRSYDDTTDSSISGTLEAQRADEYVNGLTAGYDVAEVKGTLPYLHPETTADTETGAETGTQESLPESTAAAAE